MTVAELSTESIVELELDSGSVSSEEDSGVSLLR